MSQRIGLHRCSYEVKELTCLGERERGGKAREGARDGEWRRETTGDYCRGRKEEREGDG